VEELAELIHNKKQKSSYVKPKLIKYGSVNEITADCCKGTEDYPLGTGTHHS
jgi:hypothetical protein